MPKNWQARVDELSNVGRLVHLAARFDSVDEEQVRAGLLGIRRKAFEDELKIQARRAGCGDRAPRLLDEGLLTELSETSQRDAASIVNTYNFDLAVQIQAIRNETPTANRHVYANRLATWETRRSQWKAPQIAEFTENTARSKAQAEFVRKNALTGTARLEPRTAAEPICQGWINRGNVPLEVAMNNPPPYHGGCPHLFAVTYDKASVPECGELWLGG